MSDVLSEAAWEVVPDSFAAKSGESTTELRTVMDDEDDGMAFGEVDVVLTHPSGESWVVSFEVSLRILEAHTTSSGVEFDREFEDPTYEVDEVMQLEKPREEENANG